MGSREAILTALLAASSPFLVHQLVYQQRPDQLGIVVLIATAVRLVRAGRPLLVAAGAGTPALTPASKILLRISPKGTLPSSTLTGLRLQAVNGGNNTAGAISARLVPQAATQEPGKAHRSGY